MDNITWDIAITNGCNMDCSYCFAHCKNIENAEFMSKEVLNNVFRLIKAAPESGHLIKLYGGEPLLNENIWNFLERLQEIEHYNLKCVLITNGLLIPKYQKEIKKAYLQLKDKFSVTISMDGTKQVHDKYRVDKSNNPTWERIINNIELLPNEMNIHFQSVLSPELLNNGEEVLKSVCSIIDNSSKKISWGYLPMNDGTFNNIEIEKIKDMFIIFKEALLKRIEYFENSRISIHQAYRCWSTSQYDKNNISWCNAGCGYFCIGADGMIYPCIHYYHDKKYPICNIRDIKTTIKDKYIYQKQYDGLYKHNCINCDFKMFGESCWCIGQCIYENRKNKIMKINKKVCIYNWYFGDIAKALYEKIPNKFIQFKNRSEGGRL